MSDKTDYCVIFTTTGNVEEADRLAKGLISGKLAGCVQIQEITSHYSWKGNVQKEKEYLLLIKTRASLYPKIETFILQTHPYEVPELLKIPVEAGFETYLNWINEQTSP